MIKTCYQSYNIQSRNINTKYKFFDNNKRAHMTTLNSSQNINTNQVIQNYKQLSSEDPQERYQANQFLCNLVHHDQAWHITQNMLTTVQDINFQFLGTQILYQKVSYQIYDLSKQQKKQLRDFIFGKLQDTTITFNPIVDKLASIGALISCISLLDDWKTFVSDLINFMSNSQHALKSGLYVLDRLPEELRAASRIAPGLKNAIIDEILTKQQQLAKVFLTVLNMKDTSLVKKCLQAMQSWAKSRFNFLKYTQLIKNVLMQSLQSFDKFQPAIVMMVETIKAASVNKLISNLSEWQPNSQLAKYKSQQIQSIKLLIQFILTNKQNFLFNSLDTQYIDMYLQIIKNLLLSFSFLIIQNIGFQMLNIILHFTKSNDLKTSQNTFQFWMDFSDKINKCKVNHEIKNMYAKYVQDVFLIVSKKVSVENQQILDDPDLKEDVTIDDINAMSFTQYRKQSATFYLCIYSFFMTFTGSSKYYFDKCFEFIGKQRNDKLGRGTELALFCIKSAAQSMISQQDCQYLCRFLSFIIEKGTNVYARIAVQTLLLIRDCTRQIKRNNQLCLNALNYSLYFLKDQNICHYAAESFKNLMQTLSKINDPKIVSDMLHFYNSQTFPSQQIIDNIIQGIFSTIIKLNNKQTIGHYIAQFVKATLTKFQQANKKVNSNIAVDKPYLIPIKQIKAIIQNMESRNSQFKHTYHALYKNILESGLKMIAIVIPYSLKQRQNYVKFNQLGLSCSIFKHCLKLCHQDITLQYLNILDTALSFILTKQTIVDMCPVFQLFSSTLLYFVPRNVKTLNAWLGQRIGYINNFFISFMEPINLADVDVIRTYYQIQQSLLLYNAEIFVKLGNCFQVFDLGLYILRHLNQSKMQRKVVNFLFICSQMFQIFIEKFPAVIETIIGSIPIVASISHNNLSRMFIQCAQSTPNIEQLLKKSLHANPYQFLSEQTINLIIALIICVIQPNPNIAINTRQRNFMMIVKDLHDLAKAGENPNKLTQLEFRLALWKKNKGNADQ